MPRYLWRTRKRGDPVQRHTRLCRTLQHQFSNSSRRKRKSGAYDVDVVSCACNREVLAVVREAQVRDGLSVVGIGHHGQLAAVSTREQHVLADGDRAGGNPLAGVKQIYDRVESARGEVTSSGVERSSDAAADVRREVLAQCEGGHVDDADRMLRHVREDHAISRVVEHCCRCRQLSAGSGTEGKGKVKSEVYRRAVHGGPLRGSSGIVGFLPVGHEEELVSGGDV